jgi:streptomycin 6-kinase
LLYDLADGNATLLMERIAPACALREGEPMPEAQLEILGRLAVELHDADISVPGDVPTFRDSSFRKEWIHDLQRLGLDAEVEELEGLLGGLHGLALLHNDLHTRNVIRGEEKQGYGGDEKKWYAIDPKPCLGDPHLDHFALLALTHTITETFIPSAHVLEDWVRRYAQAAQLDEAILAALVRLRALALTGWLRRHQGNENWLRYLDLLIKALD